MTYREALDYIWSGLTNYETKRLTQGAPPDFDLGRMERFVALLGDPHQRFRSLHVAGSKGKGSTCAMIASVLHAAGLKVGLYISPHLHTFRERVRVAAPSEGLFADEAMIAKEEVVRLVERLKPLAEGIPALTTFDFITALAFTYFAKEEVDLAVLEVGLGGRLDSTNVVRPLLSVITSISYEHTHILGDKLPLIAGEKAGIIKEGIPVVSAPQDPEAFAVIEEVAQERRAPLSLVGRDWVWEMGKADLEGQSFAVHAPALDISYEDLWMPLLGRHELENATLALASVAGLERYGFSIAEGSIREGLHGLQWPGRLEILLSAPLLVVDGAHNADSARRLVAALKEYFSYQRLILIYGCMADKEVAGIFQELLPDANILILTRSQSPRAALPEALAEKALTWDKTALVTQDVGASLAHALEVSEEGDLICVAGSLYLVAEAREAWARMQGQPLPEADY